MARFANSIDSSAVLEGHIGPVLRFALRPIDQGQNLGKLDGAFKYDSLQLIWKATVRLRISEALVDLLTNLVKVAVRTASWAK